MKIVREYYAIYHTQESDGLDICIKDSCDRWTLISVEELEEFIEDLVAFVGYENKLISVRKPFEELSESEE